MFLDGVRKLVKGLIQRAPRPLVKQIRKYSGLLEKTVHVDAQHGAAHEPQPVREGFISRGGGRAPSISYLVARDRLPAQSLPGS